MGEHHARLTNLSPSVSPSDVRPAASPAPSHVSAAGTSFKSALARETVADAATAPVLTDPPVAVAVLNSNPAASSPQLLGSQQTGELNCSPLSFLDPGPCGFDLNSSMQFRSLALSEISENASQVSSSSISANQ